MANEKVYMLNALWFKKEGIGRRSWFSARGPGMGAMSVPYGEPLGGKRVPGEGPGKARPGGEAAASNRQQR